MVGCMNSFIKERRVTYQGWSNCWSDYSNSNPCQYTNEFQQTKQQFMQLTYGFGSIRASAECQLFQDYKDEMDQNGYEINYQGFYEQCFFSPQVISIANSNSYFKTHYYDPIFVKCAGF